VTPPPTSPPQPSSNIRGASPPQIKRSSPPVSIDIPSASLSSHKLQPQSQTPPRTTYLGIDVQDHAHLGGWGGKGEVTPGSWSTAATPGTAQPSVEWEQVSPTRPTDEGEEMNSTFEPRRGSGSSTGSYGTGGSGDVLKKMPLMSEEIDPHAANQYYISQRDEGLSIDNLESAGTNGSDSFTPSVVGRISDSATPQIYPVQDGQGHPGVAVGWPADPFYGNLPQYSQPQGNISATFPLGFVPDLSDWKSVPPPPVISPPSPPPHQPPYHSSAQPPKISAPQPVRSQPVQNLSAPAPPVELSPSIIAKVQKHCRFAISALDYEDATQARKELRAALAVLDG
jgi:vacuolar protein sorting-associated protein VTA1